MEMAKKMVKTVKVLEVSCDFNTIYFGFSYILCIIYNKYLNLF